jgi:hypothetical protein
VKHTLVILGLICASGALGTNARDLYSAESARVDAYLRQVEQTGSVPRQFVQGLAADRSAPGQIAFAALYTHEDPRGLKGNAYDQKLVVFLRGASAEPSIVDMVVGGKMRRQLRLLRVTPTAVEFAALTYAVSDSACCPSVPALVTYRLEGRALVEARGT